MKSHAYAYSLATCMVLLGFIQPGAQAQENSRYEIRLLDERFTPPAGVSPALRQGLAREAAELKSRGHARVHFLVQLQELPSGAQRHELSARGLDLGPYVPGSAWIASVPADSLDAAARRPEVRWMTRWDAARKQHPRIKAGEFAPWTRDPSRPGWVMVFVQLHHDVEAADGQRVVEQVGGQSGQAIAGLHGMTVWIPEERLPELAKQEEILWIEEGPAPLSPTNDGVRNAMGVGTVASAPYNLTGNGVRLFIFDGGTVRATHQTFDPGTGSRVTVIDGAAAADHPTHVAGTAAGDGSGSTGTRGRGVAPQATLLSAAYEQTGGTMLFWDNAGDIQADYALARGTYDADLGTNSIGSNTASNGYPCSREGDYGVSSSLLDGIVRGDNATVGSSVIMTWANGNERTGRQNQNQPRGRCGANYVTTAPPSCAKNPIQVGAVNSDGLSMTSFSSWGPCDDGRLKPVVVAPGCESGRVSGEDFIYSSLNTSDSAYGASGWCGTSMATPAVGGLVTLLVQDWRAQGHGGAYDRPVPSLVKAVLVHSARDLGQPGPDFIYGYGAVRARAAVDLLRAGTGSLGGAGAVNWGTDSVSQGIVRTYTISVPAGTGELKASLAWDDAPAAAFAANAVVNNLNLELVSPSSAVYRPWVLSAASPHLAATTGVNNVDNQEQVLVTNPASGTWTVRVTGTSVPQGPQTFGLVYTTTAASGASCSTQAWGFESGNDGFSLTGAARVVAPATGHGSSSLRLGGTASTTDEATRDVAIPAGSSRAELNFWWYMTTQESATAGFGWDYFSAEIRNTAGTVLAVVDSRSDGWRQSSWMQQATVDVSAWAGQTVRVAFRATNDSSLPTTFYVDDVSVTTCTGPDFSLSASPSSKTVARSSSGTVSVTVSSVNGYSAATSLSVSGLPSGVTGSFSPNPVTPPANASSSSTLTLTASGAATLGTFTVTVSGTDGSRTRTATFSLTVSSGGATTVFYDGAESAATTFTTSATTSTTVWTRNSSSPYAGVWRWRAGSSAAGNYGNSGDARLTTPSLNLTGATSATLTYAYKHSTEAGYDFFEVRVSTNGGTSWTTLSSVSGLSAAWSAWAGIKTVDLSPYTGFSNVKVQFRLTTDGSVTDWGVAVDEVKVVKQ